ncbi:MAG: biotin/lipoyl-binding protein [Pirellulales bacterium]
MSRKFWIIAGVIALLVVGGGAMMGRLAKKDPAERYRQAAVERGRVVQVVNSTGTVKSVKSVDIAAFVSAPVTEVHVDFNDEVKKGDLLAKIDPRLYQANVVRDEATLAVSRADLERVTALARNAKNNEQRAQIVARRRRRSSAIKSWINSSRNVVRWKRKCRWPKRRSPKPKRICARRGRTLNTPRFARRSAGW